MPALAEGMLKPVAASSSEARKKLLEVYRTRIEKRWKGRGEGLTVDPGGIYGLNFYHSLEVKDLDILQGMPLTTLRLTWCGGVRDLSPLGGMPLTVLDLGGCGGVQDLSPLKGMPLVQLSLWRTGVRDVTPLHGMPLASLLLPEDGAIGVEGLRRIKTLAIINELPSAQFWKKYDAGEFKQYKK
jgi:hypothetical protein